MMDGTAVEYLNFASYALVQAINQLTASESTYIKNGKEAAVISTRTCLDRLYISRDEIMAVMEEQKRRMQ